MRPADTWKDYELLDATGGTRRERWGETILIRPDPQVVWKTEKQSPLWAKADAIYHRSNQGGGEWEYRRRLPEKWKITCGEGEDKLPLIVRVTGGDDGIASFKESRNLVDEGLLALSGLLIDRRFLRPVVNLDREYIKAPRHSPFWVDGIRFYQFQKVAGAGTDRVAVSRDGKAGALGYFFP